MKRSKWKIIMLFCFSLFVIIKLSSFFWHNKSSTGIEQLLKIENIESENILKTYDYSDSVDVFSIKGNKLILSVLKKDSTEKPIKYKRALNFQLENVFSDNAINLEEYMKMRVSGAVRYPTLFKGENQQRNILFGVTLDRRIVNLQIDKQKVTDIIEYKKQGKIYYIWYFKNIELKKGVEKMNITI